MQCQRVLGLSRTSMNRDSRPAGAPRRPVSLALHHQPTQVGTLETCSLPGTGTSRSNPPLNVGLDTKRISVWAADPGGEQTNRQTIWW
jgi:hypothetical protein